MRYSEVQGFSVRDGYVGSLTLRRDVEHGQQLARGVLRCALVALMVGLWDVCGSAARPRHRPPPR